MGLNVSCEKKVGSPQTVLEIVENLQYGGYEEVQQKYGAGKDHRPTLMHNAYAELPVIDLSRAVSESDVLSKELGDAAAQWGIFQIVNHGIPLETIQEIEAQGLQFFRWPTERKLKCGGGYTPISAEEPDSSLHWAEMMMISPCPYCERVKSTLDDALSVIWPEGNAELR
ncbi:hypothetical protein Mapa_007662 [Marchantia paleacea]|nr:hypothetical protein Mapa_007662 [Marchantia paleacea]